MTTKAQHTPGRERPILFSAPMVRALLDGRKTQTRRLFKVPGVMPGTLFTITSPDEEIVRFDDGTFHYASTAALSGPYPCPYGTPGDRLWVRETMKRGDGDVWRYAADSVLVGLPSGHPRVPDMLSWAHHKDGDTCVSIHMPRWASRILLEVTGVRVERLQDISLNDVRAEGCEVREFWLFGADADSRQKIGANVYRDLWESINGAGSWDANPFVWVIEFRHIEARAAIAKAMGDDNA